MRVIGGDEQNVDMLRDQRIDDSDLLLDGRRAFAEKKLRVAMVVKVLGINYFDVGRDGGQEAAKELGDVELIYAGPTAALGNCVSAVLVASPAAKPFVICLRLKSIASSSLVHFFCGPCRPARPIRTCAEA